VIKKKWLLEQLLSDSKTDGAIDSHSKDQGPQGGYDARLQETFEKASETASLGNVGEDYFSRRGSPNEKRGRGRKIFREQLNLISKFPETGRYRLPSAGAKEDNGFEPGVWGKGGRKPIISKKGGKRLRKSLG